MLGGNPDGIPVVHIAINLQMGQDSFTDNFSRQARFETVLDDTGRTVASRFQSSGQPIFAIINGVADSSSHKQWELLLHLNGYGTTQHPITLFRSVIDAVKAPAAAAPPEIVTQPRSHTASAGAEVLLSVEAKGTAPLSFQWHKDGSAIAGATSASLALNNVQPGAAGSYTVVVSNTAGSLTSQPAMVTVNVPVVPPQISAQPMSRAVAAGSTVTFSVIASGTGPLSYQWRFNGQPIAEAMMSMLTLANVQSADAGEYSVVVSNTAGTQASTPAGLTVQVPPSVSTQPQHLTVTSGGPAVFSAMAMGTEPLRYQWHFNGQAVVGATEPSFKLAKAEPAHAGTYHLVVTNALGAVASSQAVLTVLVPVQIAAQPQSQTVKAGASVTFSVVASGSEPLSYQWQFNGADVAGAAGSSLTLHDVNSAQAGTYTVTVRNATGTLSSAGAALVVIREPAAAPRLRQIERLADGTCRLVLEGEVDQSYRLEASSDLVTWARVETLRLTANAVTFHDRAAAGFETRFYRAVAE